MKGTVCAVWKLRIMRLVQGAGVFLGCFCLAYVCGSLAFVTRDSSAEGEGSILTIDILSAVALTVTPSTLELNIVPSPTGELSSGDIEVRVGSNNLTGYKLSMEVDSASTSLMHANGVDEIVSTGNSPANVLAANTWGWNLGLSSVVGDSFEALPAVGSNLVIDEESGPNANKVINVAVGAKANMAIPSGEYLSTLVFTVVTNHVPVPMVSEVIPASARAGDMITVIGDNFYGGGSTSAVSDVRVGAEVCANVTVTSNTSLTCMLPGTLSEGNYPVTVTTPLRASNNNVNVTIVAPLVVQPGSVPGNIDPATNAAALDVYPTTGWGDEVVTITSNGRFTTVRDVTIGGTSCSQYDVISASVIACKLPVKTAGSVNDVAVMSGASAPGTNITPAATYTHMKITYFDPSVSAGTLVSVGGETALPYYPDGITSAICSSLTPSNSTSMALPASIVYMRDARNNQVYKVKKMMDDKCWMIDNLKFIGDPNAETPNEGGIQNFDGAGGTPGTKGITYRNGRGPNIPTSGTDAYNTIDGTSTGSATNSNKAFYNNPMSDWSCYTGIIYSSGYIEPVPIFSSNSLTHCGYLYNWYATTAGTGTYDTNGMSTYGNQATGDICPANFRLPSATSSASGPTTNGTAVTHADFPVLNASMANNTNANGSGNMTYSPSALAGWLPSGAWSGSISGNWLSVLSSQGSWGFFWSSTTSSAADALDIYIERTLFFDEYISKHAGIAVRCLIQ